MTKEELIANIRILTDYNGVNLKDIEKTLKMPTNSLSGMVNGSRPFAKKWLGPVEAFVKARLEGASQIVIPVQGISTTPPPPPPPPTIPAKKGFPPQGPATEMPPAGLSRSEQLRWFKEKGQTLR